MGKPARNFSRNLRRLPIPAAATRCFAATTAAYALLPGMALANPTGGVVVGGSASIGHPASNGTVIDQTSQSAIINWQQFNIAGNEYVQFVQPSASSVVLNRIIGGSPSEIFGSLSANGRVFLINPSGIMFAPGAQLDVGSLFASTMDIKNSDFMSGKYVFASTGAAGGTVSNAGTIKAGDGGFVVLAGDYVKNTGIVQARLGQVVLASGSQVTMGLDNSGLVSFAVDNATLAKKAGVDNAGQLLADGGRVVMTAKTARDLVSSAVNNSGLVRAQGIAEHNGEIELTASGGDITDSGTLDASSATGAGGTIDVRGDANIDIQAGAQVLASGATQGGAVQIVADRNLDTRAGSLIKATGAAGKGGKAELSGHAKLTLRGDVDLGKGGTLTLDPTNLTIAAGSGSSSSATVYQSFVQSELQAGTNVNLVATNNITLADLGAGGVLNGHNPDTSGGGSLLLGIGTLNPASGQYVEGTGGTIDFVNTANSIVVDGTLTLDAGSTTGSVKVGNLTGSMVDVKANDGITVGAVTATHGSISLSAANGAITGGSLSATAIGATGSETADIVVNAGGAVNLLNLSATAQNRASVGSTSANALIRVNANTANLGGNLAVGNITAKATASFGAAGASVALQNQNSGVNVGTLSAGSILTSASAASGADGSVALTNDNGSIGLGTQSITTNAFGSTANGAITLYAYGTGGISAGALSAGTGNVYLYTVAGNVGVGDVTASRGTISLFDTGGNIVAGNLLAQDSSGTSTDAHIVVESAGGIQVGSVTTSANVDGNGDAIATVSISANYFGTGGGDLIAGPIRTRAQSGGSSHSANASVYLYNAKGSISVNDGKGGAGSIQTVARGINRNDDISLYAYNGGNISTGNLGASNGAVTAATNGSGSITLGALSGASSGYGGQLTSVSISAGGPLAIGGSGITAGAITLSDNAGGFSFGGGTGMLTATNGHVAINVTGGDLRLGAISATNGNVAITDGSGSLFVGNIADYGGSVALYATNNSITAGNIFTQTYDYGGSANASVSVYARNAVSVGTITTDAEVLSGAGGANASVNLQPGYGGTGDLTAGTIHTRAVSGGSHSADAHVSINVNGNLNLGSNSITAVALGAGTNLSNVALTAYSGGNITVGNINTNGSISAHTGGTGNIALGALSGASSYGAPAVIDVTSAGSLAINAPTLRAGTITLSAATGNFSFAGSISATGGALNVTDNGGNLVLGNLAAGQGGINLTASQGAISAGNVTVTSISSGGSADAHLSALAHNGIQLGTISTTAQSLASNHNANASVDIEADYNGGGSGDLVTGSISTSAAHGGSGAASASVYLYDGNGNINLGGNGITTAAAGAAANDDVTLTAYNAGSITAGAISGGGAKLNAYTNGTGGIALGALSGSSHAALASVQVQAGGTLTIGGSNITAGHIALTAGAGDFIFGGGSGTLTADGGPISVYVSSGSLSLGAVAATGGGVTLSDTGGNLTVGNVTAIGGSIGLTAYNGSIATGNLSAQTLLGSGTAVASIVAQANNSVTVGSVTTDAEITAGSGNAYGHITLAAGYFGGSGQLTVNGPVATTARAGGPGGYADGSVNLSSGHGGIDPPPLVDITTDAMGAGIDGDITLTANGGDIVFGNLTATNANITVTTYNSGNISLGALSGGTGAGDQLASVSLNSAGSLVLGTPTFQAGSIALSSNVGDLNFGALTATDGSVNVSANGGNLIVGDVSADNGGTASSSTIVLNAAGNLSAGALATHAVGVGGVTADINVNAGGSITVGAITTSATVTGTSGSASADVQLSDYSASVPVGDISVNGAISTSAVSAGAGYSADGHVSIYNHDGGINTNGNSITTNASGSSISGDISLTSYSSGDIATGNLTATDAGISAYTYYSAAGQGNIGVGILSGGSGMLTQVQFQSSGTLTLGGSALTAGAISLEAGAGDFTYGDLTSTAGSINVLAANGSVSLGNLLAQDTQAGGATADISVYSAGGIATGSVTTNAVSTASNGYASGNVYLYANYYGNLGGDLVVGGPLSANASAGGGTYNSATADVALSNGYGSGKGGSVRTGSITAAASGARYLQDSISAYSGNGGIDTGDISGGGILLQSSGLVGVGSHSYGIFTGKLNASARAGVSIDAGTGDIELASVNVNNAATGSYGGATAYIYAYNGGVDVAGTVGVLAAQRQSTLSIYASKDIHLHGGVTVSGGGGSGSLYSNPATMAEATLHATGMVIVDGKITVAGSAFNATGSSGDSRYRGDGVLNVSGASVSLGDIAVSGVGNASINVSAGTTMVLGSVSASATRDRSFTTSGGRTTIDDGGLALINLLAGSGADASHIQTGGLTAAGPNAVVNVQAGTLDLRNGASGKAVSVTAYSGGSSDGGSGAYYRSSYGGAPVVASDFGAARANLLARDNGGGTGIVSGGIAVAGPEAILQLVSRNDITVTGDLSAQGLGYTITGDGTQLPSPYLVGAPQQPLLLNTGTTTWGRAQLLIGGSSYGSAGAGKVAVNGNVAVNGIGEGLIKVLAGSLTVGDVTATAAAGTLHGTQTSTIYTGSNAGYMVTRTYSDGSGGAAQYGRAAAKFVIGSASGDATLNSLTVQGASEANATFDGGRNIAITGNVLVANNLAGTPAVYDEAVTFSPFGGTGSIAAADTHIVGGEATLGVGFRNGVMTPVASFAAGGIELDGFGFVGTVIDAGQINTGVMSVSQQAGSYFSNDPTRTATTLQWTNPGVGILLDTGSPTIQSQGQSITITAAGPVALGLNASLSGDFTLNAASIDATLPGLVLAYNPPLGDGIPSSFAGAAPPPPDLTLPGLNLSAANITIDFSAASSLPVLNLLASQALSIDGAGATLAAGSPVSLTGGTVSITHVGDLSANGAITIGATSSEAGATAIDIGSSGLTANGPITLASAGGITVSSAMLSAQGSLSLTGSGGAVSISGALLRAANTTVSAHTGLTVSNSTIAGGSSGTGAASVTLDAINGSVDLSNSTMLGNQLSLSAGTDLTVSNTLLAGGQFTGGSGSIAGAKSLSLTAVSGMIGVANSGLFGKSVTVSAGTDLNISSSTLAGASSYTGETGSGRTTGADTITLTAKSGAGSLNGALLFGNVVTAGTGGNLAVLNSVIAGGSQYTRSARSYTGGSSIGLSAGGTLSVSKSLLMASSIGLSGAAGASISLSTLDAGTSGSVAVASSAGSVTVTGSTLNGAKLGISGHTGASVDSASTLAFGSSIDIASQGATVIGGALSTPGTLQVSGGSVSASDLSGTTVKVTSTAGGITVGNVTASGISSDAVMLQAANGLTGGNITANGMYVLATDGNITLGNLKIGTGDFTLLSSTSASGAFQTVGNIDYAGAGGLSFYADNTNFTFNFGNINAASLLMSFSGNETVHIGNVTSPGNVTIGTNLGALSFGNISGNNVDISTNHDLSFSGLTLDAAGNLTLAVTGSLGVTGSTLYGQNVGISGTTGLNVSSTTITGSAGAAANSITLGSSAGDVTLASDTLSSTGNTSISAGGMLSLNAVTIDPAVLNLTGTTGLSVTGSSLTGGPITLDATAGAVTVSGSTLDGTSLAIDAATGISISADSSLLSTSFIDLASTAGTVMLGGNLNNGGAVSISGGSLSTGNLSGSSIDLTATSGNLDTGSLTAGTNITLTASKGLVDVAGLMTLGTTGNGALQVTGLGVTTQDIVNDSPLAAVGPANDMSITATGGSISTGNFSTAGVGTVYLVLSATGGSISTGNIDLEGLNAQATGNVSLGNLVLNSLTPGAAGNSQVASSGGSVTVGTFTSNHGLSVNAAGAVDLGSAQVSGNLGVTGGGSVTLAGASASGGITLQGASVSTADLSGASVSVTSTTGGVTVGNVGASNASADPVMLQAADGLAAGDITANGMYVLATDGNITLGNLKIGTGDFTLLSSTSVAGAFMTVGNIDYAGPNGLSFSATDHNFTFNFGNIDVNSLSMSFNGNETVHLGNVTSPGNVTIGTNAGALSFGNISGNNVDISTNHDLSFSGLTLDAAGNLTLAITGSLDVTGSGLYGQNVSVTGSTGLSLANTGVGGTLAGGVGTTATTVTLDGGTGTLALSGTTIDGTSDALSGGAGVTLGNSLVSGGGNAPATSVTLASANGALTLNSSSIAATGIDASAAGGIALNNSVLSNGSLTAALVHGNATAAPGISLSSTGDITVTGSTVSGTRLTLGGNNIHFVNGSLLTGTTAVSLTAGGRLDASGGASTINAGALSARAALINLSDASLVVGTGIASFGSDPGLLQQLRSKAPALLPLSSGPNASFYASGPGGITLGKISLAGGYMFAQGQTLTMTSPTGAANIFVDYLPLDPTAVLNLNLIAPPGGVTTFVFGGTPQTGNIFIGNGSQTFNLTGNTNLVFASSGTTYYPDAISTGGQVLVLGQEILLNNTTIDPNTIPLTPTDYNNDQPAQGVLGYPADPGNVNNDGVNDANRGFIDLQTSQQPALSCGIGGT